MASNTSLAGQRLVFTGKQEVKLESFEIRAPNKDEIVVESHLTLMSTGTENIIYNRLFDPGTPVDNWVKYPFYPGYLSVGHVTAVGSEVTGMKVADRVVSRVGHSSHFTMPSSLVYQVPDGIPDANAVWFGLAKIAWFGANAAQYRLGDSVLIIGAGPIGQMSIRWARVAGAASIIVVDSFPERIPFAQAGGATAAIVAPIEDAREAVLAANQNKLPRVVMDSTGNAAVFASALNLVRSHGTVVVMGDTGTPAKQHLTGDVVLRGIHIVGAHDSHDTEEWNTRTLTKLAFDLALSGRFPLDGLTTHSFTPSQCEEAYAQANRDRAKTMGIVFDWANKEKK
jgi:2-desacetyl-2-hydroxyethyl bacteriochlorophyllide A dehydrogenase